MCYFGGGVVCHANLGTETSVPYAYFRKAGFEVAFATENGRSPECDRLLYRGALSKLIGAGKAAVGLYHEMRASDECRHPLAWSAPDFSLDPFDCVYLPGGHERGVRQIIDSPAVHRLMAAYVPKCRKPGRKAVVAVCHGVMVLSESKGGDGKSAIHECTTTTLPAGFERVAFWGTRWFLGSYYKTYGPNSANVEDFVTKALDDPKTQYKRSLGLQPFIVEDEKFNYITGRFPGDCELLSEAAVKLVKSLHEGSSSIVP